MTGLTPNGHLHSYNGINGSPNGSFNGDIVRKTAYLVTGASRGKSVRQSVLIAGKESRFPPPRLPHHWGFLGYVDT
jgi:hypothetical protein